MAYIQTINGGFTQDDQGNLNPYQSVNPYQAQQTEQVTPFGGFDAGSQSANMAINGNNQAAAFINSLQNPTGGAGGAGGTGSQPGFQQPSWLPQDSFQQNTGGTDALGNYSSLNNRNFSTLESANALAKQLGANVTQTNYGEGRNPEYNLDFGRGSNLNAGQIAYYFGPNSSFAGIRDPQDRYNAIMRSIEDELRYNDSGMERQIMDNRDPVFGQQKDVAGGYQSFQPGQGGGAGGSAPSLSNDSMWSFRGGDQPWQQAANMNPGAWMGNVPGGVQGGSIAPATTQTNYRPPQTNDQSRQMFGSNMFNGGTGPNMMGAGQGGQYGAGGGAGMSPNSPYPQYGGGGFPGMGSGYGGFQPGAGGYGWGMGGSGGMSQFNPMGGYGNMQGFAQTMNNVNGMRNAMPYSPQRQPYLPGRGFGQGQSYGNGYYYPQMSSGFGRGYY